MSRAFVIIPQKIMEFFLPDDISIPWGMWTCVEDVTFFWKEIYISSFYLGQN